MESKFLFSFDRFKTENSLKNAWKREKVKRGNQIPTWLEHVTNIKDLK